VQSIHEDVLGNPDLTAHLSSQIAVSTDFVANFTAKLDDFATRFAAGTSPTPAGSMMASGGWDYNHDGTISGNEWLLMANDLGSLTATGQQLVRVLVGASGAMQSTTGVNSTDGVLSENLNCLQALSLASSIIGSDQSSLLQQNGGADICQMTSGGVLDSNAIKVIFSQSTYFQSSGGNIAASILVDSKWVTYAGDVADVLQLAIANGDFKFAGPGIQSVIQGMTSTRTTSDQMCVCT